MFAWGAVVGIVAGVIALATLGRPDGEIDWLIRIALLLPGVVYVAWWLIGPGIGPSVAEHGELPKTLDAQQRLERIESTFDSAAVPRPRRAQPAIGEDAPGLREFRASIRRAASTEADSAKYGVRDRSGS